jgi:hypothetical protein
MKMEILFAGDVRGRGVTQQSSVLKLEGAISVT